MILNWRDHDVLIYCVRVTLPHIIPHWYSSSSSWTIRNLRRATSKWKGNGDFWLINYYFNCVPFNCLCDSLNLCCGSTRKEDHFLRGAPYQSSASPPLGHTHPMNQVIMRQHFTRFILRWKASENFEISFLLLPWATARRLQLFAQTIIILIQ